MNLTTPNFHVSEPVKMILVYFDSIRLFFFFMTVPIISCPEVDIESQAKQVDQMIPGFHLNDSTGANNGFTLLGEGETPTLSHQMKVSA